MDIIDLPLIDIHGEGVSTEKLIEIIKEYVSKAKNIYQNIWVVFDKDDFADFDSAVALGKCKEYSVV